MKTGSRIRQTFGNYRLKSLIDKGGYAEVYLAENALVNNLQYAVKIFKRTDLQDYNQEEFLIEAKNIASLRNLSTHIVEISDVGVQIEKEDGEEYYIPYIVMEYAAAGTLRSHYNPGDPVPIAEIVLYTKQIAEALQCAHDHKPHPIIHLDVKPENMLLRSVGHVLLSDFGISMSVRTGPQKVASSKKGVVGTANYIAPERLAGQARRASDQYSLGAVVYEWICGYPPFSGTDREICRAHIKEPPPPLYPDYPYVTEKLWKVVARALAKKPEDRYPTVMDFALALEAAVTPTKPSQATTVGPTPAPAPQPVQMPANPPRLASSPPQQSVPPTLPAQPVQPIGPAPSAQPVHPIQPTQPARPASQPTPVLPPVPQVSLSTAQTQELPPAWPPAASVAPTPLPGGRLKLPANTTSYQHHASKTELISPWGVATAQTAQSQPAQQEDRAANGLGEFFAMSPEYARDHRYTFFINMGTILNVLSALLIGWLLHNVAYIAGGILLSSLFFWLCMRFVEKLPALLCGALVACYWGYVGWIVGNYLAAQYGLYTFYPSLLLAVIFTGGSMIAHSWYVARKEI